MIHQVGREIPGDIQIKLYFSHETVANLKNVDVILKYAYLKNIITTVNYFSVNSYDAIRLLRTTTLNS